MRKRFVVTITALAIVTTIGAGLLGVGVLGSVKKLTPQKDQGAPLSAAINNSAVKSSNSVDREITPDLSAKTVPTTPEEYEAYNQKMLEAGKNYWLQKYGNDGATVKLLDLGCHSGLQVVRGDKVVAQLAFDGQNITEIEI